MIEVMNEYHIEVMIKKKKVCEKKNNWKLSNFVTEKSIMEGLAASMVTMTVEQFLCKGMGNEASDKWEKWLRHFKLMLSIKQITEPEMKKSLLLYSAGPQVQEVFDALPTANVE